MRNLGAGKRKPRNSDTARSIKAVVPMRAGDARRYRGLNRAPSDGSLPFAQTLMLRERPGTCCGGKTGPYKVPGHCSNGGDCKQLSQGGLTSRGQVGGRTRRLAAAIPPFRQYAAQHRRGSSLVPGLTNLCGASRHRLAKVNLHQ